MTDDGGQRRQATDAALRYLTPRARSTQEMRLYLTRRDIPADVAEGVLTDLQRRGLLDDLEFARNWIEWRMRSKPAGTRLVERELQDKGIPAETIEQLLSESAGAMDSVPAAAAVLRRQHRRYAGLERTAAYRRLLGLLARRGFDQHIARKAVDLVWEEWHRHEGN